MAKDEVSIDWIGGNCPVQAEGRIDNKPFYFRARGQHWSIGVGGEPVDHPAWSYDEDYGDDQHAAGWMEIPVALELINKAATLYRKSK